MTNRDLAEYLEMKILDHTIRDDEYGLYIEYKSGKSMFRVNKRLCKRIIKEINKLEF